MDKLYSAVYSTPIIDHHAHNLLYASALHEHDLLSITSEASGVALQDATSTLAHIRAVKQLAEVLQCEASWPVVLKIIEGAQKKPNDAWARRCFEGIETVLIDDGLDPSNVHPYNWHDRLTRTKCKRIVRIERVAEDLINRAIAKCRKHPPEARGSYAQWVVENFEAIISDTLDDPEVAGFKSVICYRTGLDIQHLSENAVDALGAISSILNDEKLTTFNRLEDSILSPYFVHVTAALIQASAEPKPFQFHTGLGDNDINLRLSNPSFMQQFIETYPNVPIVLLHASYPFTAEAGYLASVYKNGQFKPARESPIY